MNDPLATSIGEPVRRREVKPAQIPIPVRPDRPTDHPSERPSEPAPVHKPVEQPEKVRV